MLYDQIVYREPIEKGWSGDKKYCARTAEGSQYLLRIAPVEHMERRRRQFEKMAQLAELNIPICRDLEFGACSEGVYIVQSWVDGQDAESVIPTLPEKQQYAYGQDAGRILQRIHSIPAPTDAPDWEERFNQKIDRKLNMYASCPMKYDGDAAILSYISQNRKLLRDRPQSYQHGDYHIGNMMINRDGVLTVIDFEKEDYGDPWEEFNRIVWCAQAAPAFASGMVDGYFDGDVPLEFWKLLALYICSNTLSSLPWAIPFGEREIKVMHAQAKEMLEWYDKLNRVVPTWYRQVL